MKRYTSFNTQLRYNGLIYSLTLIIETTEKKHFLHECLKV